MIFRKIISFIFLLFILFSCHYEKQPTIPAYVIPKEKMVNIIVDIHIIDAMIKNNKDPVEQRFVWKQDIFKKYNIDSIAFDTSMSFYSQNPKLLDEIYEGVINELSKKHGEIVTQKP